ncbi:MAG TPA: hypothetical protein VM580_13480, partial [Labilithrix sp.]|nr:hypothetical protein [Labilithrix sp.]
DLPPAVARGASSSATTGAPSSLSEPPATTRLAPDVVDFDELIEASPDALPAGEVDGAVVPAVGDAPTEPALPPTDSSVDVTAPPAPMPPANPRRSDPGGSLVGPPRIPAAKSKPYTPIAAVGLRARQGDGKQLRVTEVAASASRHDPRHEGGPVRPRPKPIETTPGSMIESPSPRQVDEESPALEIDPSDVILTATADERAPPAMARAPEAPAPPPPPTAAQATDALPSAPELPVVPLVATEAEKPSVPPPPIVFAKSVSSLAFEPTAAASAPASDPPSDRSDDAPSRRRSESSEASHPSGEEAWANGGGSESEAPARVRRRSGRKVAGVLAVVTLSCCALILYARHAYRGAHDTNEGLGLRPPSLTASSVKPEPPVPATVQPVDTSASATEDPVEIPPSTPESTSTNTSASAAATASSPTPSTSAAPARTTAAATTPSRPKTTTDHRPTAAASTGTTTGGGLSSESITKAAQRALEGKDKDDKQGSRAAQLAFLATRQDPGNADAWLTLGAAYEAMGKKPQAIDAYRNCARRASGHPRVARCKQLAGIKD